MEKKVKKEEQKMNFELKGTFTPDDLFVLVKGIKGDE